MFDEYTYEIIEDEISGVVMNLNIRRNLIDLFIRRKEYHKEIPSLEEFNKHQKPIKIYSKNGRYNSQRKIANLRPGGSFGNRLEGTLYDSEDKKGTQEIRKTIHALSHKYNIKVDGSLIQ